jgi:hypothetical protein
VSHSPRLVYTSRTDATAQNELAALHNVYRFVLERHAKKNAAGVTSTNGDDAKERSKDDSSARNIIQDYA